MTDERKDELFNEAIYWITEHAIDNEELYRALRSTMGMTDEEIQECGIDYLNEYFTDNPEKTLLFSKSNTYG